MSDSFYDVLGINKQAESNEIKKAYMKLVKTHHPDKGGDAEEFKKIQHAYEVLSDDNKRQIYDLTGKDPDQNGGGGGGGGSSGNPFGGMPFPPGFHFDIGNLFGMFGSHMGGSPAGNQMRKRSGKPPPKVEHIGINLSQFYNGHQFQVFLDRHKFCSTCSGDGSKKKESCQSCSGSGTQTQVINMNGMTLHSRSPCSICIGKGYKTTEVCSECAGQGKVSEKKHLQANVLPGMKYGETFVFENACSETPEFEQPGDLHIVINQIDDPNGWKRIGNNGQHLENHVTISLAESLVGCVIRLDGHPAYDDGLFVKIPEGTFAGDILTIVGLGMPIRGEANSYGDLYIRINVSIKLNERRILQSDAAQTGLKALFKDLCREVDGYEEGKTELQKDVFLSRI